MTTDKRTILGYPNLLDRTRTNAAQDVVRICGGSWDTNRPRSNLQDPLLINAARSTNAAKANTWLNFDLGYTVGVKLFAVPRHNLSRAAQYRLMASTAASFSGVTVNGSHSSGATSLSLTMSGNGTIWAGDGFTIAGDSTFYQASASKGFGSNLIQNSHDASHASYTYAIDGSSFTRTTGIDDPFGGYNAVRFAWSTGGSGLIRNTGISTLTNGATYNYSLWVRVVAVTRSSGTGTIDLDLGDGSLHSFNSTTTPLGQWVRINTDCTAGASSWADIQRSAGVTSYTIDIIGMQVTAGSGVKDYAYSSGGAVTSGTQSISFSRVDSATTGLAAAASGGAAVTCESGRFYTTDTSTTLLDTGLLDVWEDYYESGELPSWHPSYSDMKIDPDRAAEHPQPLIWIKTEDDEVIATPYWRLYLEDTANSDGYLSLARAVFAAETELRGVSYASSFGRVSYSALTQSRGGAGIANRQSGGRAHTLTLDTTTEIEAWRTLQRLVTEADITEQVMVVLDKNDTKHKAERAYLARLRQMPSFSFSAAGVGTVTLDVEEVIA